MAETAWMIRADEFDDPVGHWYKCSECKEDVFMPLNKNHDDDVYCAKYCPICGKEIEYYYEV